MQSLSSFAFCQVFTNRNLDKTQHLYYSHTNIKHVLSQSSSKTLQTIKKCQFMS